MLADFTIVCVLLRLHADDTRKGPRDLEHRGPKCRQSLLSDGVQGFIGQSYTPDTSPPHPPTPAVQQEWGMRGILPRDTRSWGDSTGPCPELHCGWREEWRGCQWHSSAFMGKTPEPLLPEIQIKHKYTHTHTHTGTLRDIYALHASP